MKENENKESGLGKANRRRLREERPYADVREEKRRAAKETLDRIGLPKEVQERLNKPRRCPACNCIIENRTTV